LELHNESVAQRSTQTAQVTDHVKNVTWFLDRHKPKHLGH